MKGNIFLLAGVAAAVMAIAACGKKDAKTETPAEGTAAGAPESPDATANVAEENRAASEKFLAENAKREGVQTTSTGLQYEVLEEGPEGGLSPKATDIVTVHYVGTLIDGVEFDSSRARGAAARFPLNGVISGWTEGVQLMSEGDRYRFYIPSDEAYGEQSRGEHIGPNDALIFDIELLKVSNPELNAKKSAEFFAANAQKPGVKTTESGLQYEVITEGPADGESPSDANVVSINYKGTFIDGSEFDSSEARGEPVEFPVGEAIAGWSEALQLMSVGDKYRFFIPSELAFGETGTQDYTITPNEAVIYELELIDVK
jgi:peptidylprolyl isomerase